MIHLLKRSRSLYRDSRLNNQKGSVVLNLIMASVAVTLFVSHTINYISHINTIKRINVSLQGLELRNHVKTVLLNNDSWRKTIESNKNMKCLKDKTDCSDFKLHENEIDQLVDASGTIIWGGENSDQQFICANSKKRGEKISSSCVAVYKIYWQPLCDTDCSSPLVKLTTELTPLSQKVSLNPQKYNLSFIR